MEFEIKSICKLVLDYDENTKRTQHVSTSVNLRVSSNLQENHYLDDKGLPTVHGTQALTNIHVQGLIANIHQAHKNGFRDSADHLRFIISELEKGFMEVTNITTDEDQLGE